MNLLMKCGHSANAVEKNNQPCCAICIGFTEKATQPDAPPDLTGRKATCAQCSRSSDSTLTMAFFEYTPRYATDRYYCGCRGWN